MSTVPIKRKRAPATATRKPAKHLDHAAIERMAASEAASRAAERRDMIATAAYFRAEKRGFEPGHEVEDWLAAELEIAHIQQLCTLSPGADCIS